MKVWLVVDEDVASAIYSSMQEAAAEDGGWYVTFNARGDGGEYITSGNRWTSQLGKFCAG